MKCPKCEKALTQVYLKEVPIEQCSDCQGIWLDYGEFELIAQREKAEQGWFSSLLKNLINTRGNKAASSTNEQNKTQAEQSSTPQVEPPQMPKIE